MKTFDIKAKGSLTNYIQNNKIKAKGETILLAASKGKDDFNPMNSCYGIQIELPFSKKLTIA
ncbi:hypothetical protein GCM10027275_23990 [Rhabdobacter roseus]|uniref:Folate-dependent tRNA-U54 methylase TrmFO/GidA n=1 Tax=Rhabdobacter roseus TaxID=1655419 RepID=A0A840TXG5_9BACT|nr:hypothetical protein [Rhabdobacter roseus]MBB5284339.1 folate-dependent tRNA-U54 methylase TrmFO/GidA [Rhabdobacter roseus]